MISCHLRQLSNAPGGLCYNIGLALLVPARNKFPRSTSNLEYRWLATGRPK
jgi:hypothetical protein